MHTDYQSLQPTPKYTFRAYIYFFEFCCTMAFSFYIPHTYPYIKRHLGTESTMALVMMLKTIGNFVGSVLFGYMHNYCTTKLTLIVNLIVALVSSTSYFAADYFQPNAALWIICVGRLLEGLRSGGEQSIANAYVSEVVEDSHKLQIFSELGISALAGFLVASIVGYFIGECRFEIFGLHFDKYTWPGAIMTLLFLASFIATLFFKEVPHNERRGRLANTYKIETVKPNILGVLIAYVITGVVYLVFNMNDTVNAPIMTDHNYRFTNNSFAWDLSALYILLLGQSILAIVQFLIMRKISGKFDVRKMLLWGLGFGMVGYLLMFDFIEREVSPAMYIVGFYIMVVGNIMVRNLGFILLSNIIGPYKSGAYMGWSLAIGTVISLIGPIWGAYAIGVSLTLCFGAMIVLLLSMGLGLVALWKQCDTHPYFKQEKDKQSQQNYI